MRRLWRERDGFTLVELLVVILVIAILMAVAAPSFLGQTKKAQDSVAKQELTLSYKAAKALSTEATDQGSYAEVTAGKLHDIEPGIEFASDNGDDPPANTVLVGHSGDDLILQYLSESGNLCILTAPMNAQQSLECHSGGGVPVNSSPPAITGTPELGQNLAADPGTWTHSPASYSYQWQRSADDSDWSDIGSGGTSSSYAISNSDLDNYLRVVVSAGGSSTPVASDPTSSQVAPTPHAPLGCPRCLLRRL